MGQTKYASTNTQLRPHPAAAAAAAGAGRTTTRGGWMDLKEDRGSVQDGITGQACNIEA